MSKATQTHHAADERRYTPQELALLWQCSTVTVYNLLRAKKRCGFKVGRDWRSTESAVRAYEENPDNQNPRPYPRMTPVARQPTPAVMRVV